MDKNISDWIFNTFGESKAFAYIMKFITNLGGFFAIAIIIGILMCFKKTRKTAIYAIIVCSLCWALNELILKNIVQRQRPFVDNESLKGVCELAKYKLPSGYSMASGHSVTSMTLCVCLIWFYKGKGCFSLFYTFLVGISRICLCVHYFSDVLAGWGIGLIFGLALCFAVSYIEKYIKKKGDKYEKNNTSNIK